MRYEFTFDLEIADTQPPRLNKTVTQLDGYAVLGQQHGEGWRIEAIHLDCFPFGEVEVLPDHYLRQPIELWLLKEPQLTAIDDAWGAHVRERKAEAAL